MATVACSASAFRADSVEVNRVGADMNPLVHDEVIIRRLADDFPVERSGENGGLIGEQQRRYEQEAIHALRTCQRSRTLRHYYTQPLDFVPAPTQTVPRGQQRRLPALGLPRLPHQH